MRFKALILILIIISMPYVQAQTKEDLIDCNAVDIKHGEVQIQILPDLELFQVLCELSGTYSDLNTLDFQYRRDIHTAFDPYQNHAAVTDLRKILEHHVSHNRVKAYILNNQYNNDPDNLHLLRMGAEQTRLRAIAELRAACRQFAQDTAFVTFFEDHRSYYEKKVQDVNTALTDLDLITSREAFWGIAKDRYRIVLTLLERDIHSCWFTHNGQQHSLFLLTPRFSINGDAVFGNAEVSDPAQGKIAARDHIYYGSGHEFGHSVVNLLTPQYEAQINSLPLQYQKSGQPTKIDFLNESILRTFTAYEFVQQGMEDVAQMVVQAEAMNGYVYNEQLLGQLREYDQNREQYPSFKDFLPHLLSALKQSIGR